MVKHGQRNDGTRATEDEIQWARGYNVRGRRIEGKGGVRQPEEEKPKEYKSRKFVESDSASSES